MHVPAAAMAHGEHRQLELAMTLATAPKLLLLDEPMAGMSQAESEEMVQLLKGLKGKYAIVLVEHDMDAVFALADRISVLVYGRVVASGTPEEIRNNQDVRDAYLGDQQEGNMSQSPQAIVHTTARETCSKSSDIETFYGTSQALFGMEFSLRQGEFTTLLGRNGMGKSTTVKTVMGLLRPKRSGTIRFRRRGYPRLAGLSRRQAGPGPGARRPPRLPQSLGARKPGRHRQQPLPAIPRPGRLQRVYALFPRLKERERNLGANLSGGEQQMLAIGRALMTNPRLLILDEATEGLAPLIRKEIWDCLAALKGLEPDRDGDRQKHRPPALPSLADAHHIVEKGRVVWSGTSEELRARPELLHQYVGV